MLTPEGKMIAENRAMEGICTTVLLLFFFFVLMFQNTSLVQIRISASFVDYQESILQLKKPFAPLPVTRGDTRSGLRYQRNHRQTAWSWFERPATTSLIEAEERTIDHPLLRVLHGNTRGLRR
jgi:hypothetical protein